MVNIFQFVNFWHLAYRIFFILFYTWLKDLSNSFQSPRRPFNEFSFFFLLNKRELSINSYRSVFTSSVFEGRKYFKLFLIHLSVTTRAILKGQRIKWDHFDILTTKENVGSGILLYQPFIFLPAGSNMFIFIYSFIVITFLIWH